MNIYRSSKTLTKRLVQFVHGVLPLAARSLPSKKAEQGRVDKGKSGQAQVTAVSGGFGGGILSHDVENRRVALLGNRVTLVTQLKSNNGGAAD